MKITVTITLNIDPRAWAETYGLAQDEVAADAKEYWRSGLYDIAQDRLAAEHLGHVIESV